MLMDIDLYLAIATLVFFIAFFIDIIIGGRRMTFLRDVEPLPKTDPPRVSVVIPACNEAVKIEQALLSILNQDYPDLEIIVIDDRSTDATGDILDRMADDYPRWQVIHKTELPPKWLGKNHALHVGAGLATGELLLFTDADVVMKPSTISRAVTFMQVERLDHLALGIEIRMPGWFLRLFAGAFTLYFSLYARPWKARDPRSKMFVGIGAFNMIRTAAYRAIGGHEKIRMRPDDDMKLGKLIKRAGFSQDVAFGRDLAYVEWYSSVKEVIVGLLKNGFAGVEYSIAGIIGGAIAQFILFVWPYPALLYTDGITRLLYLGIILITLLLCWYTAGAHRLVPWFGLGLPICTVLFIYILFNSMFYALIGGGIQWRGTFYSLKELKANKV